MFPISESLHWSSIGLPELGFHLLTDVTGPISSLVGALHAAILRCYAKMTALAKLFCEQHASEHPPPHVK